MGSSAIRNGSDSLVLTFVTVGFRSPEFDAELHDRFGQFMLIDCKRVNRSAALLQIVRQQLAAWISRALSPLDAVRSA
jgi:hypothetical protein